MKEPASTGRSASNPIFSEQRYQQKLTFQEAWRPFQLSTWLADMSQAIHAWMPIVEQERCMLDRNIWLIKYRCRLQQALSYSTTECLLEDEILLSALC